MTSVVGLAAHHKKLDLILFQELRIATF